MQKAMQKAKRKKAKTRQETKQISISKAYSSREKEL